MRALAVLPQTLSMVCGDEDDRARGFVRHIERPEQTRELAVDERDLAVVRRLTVPLGQIRRRLVWRVRIVIVNPEEPARLGRSGRTRRSEPAKRRIGRRIREPLHVGGPATIVPFGQTIVVDLEPPVEPESAIEWEAGHEGRRTVARLPKILGRRFDLRRQHESAVVPEAVTDWNLAGQDRRM